MPKNAFIRRPVVALTRKTASKPISALRYEENSLANLMASSLLEAFQPG